MPIPTQTDMFTVVLGLMQDGVERSRKQIKELAKDSLQLTPEECSYKTSSGEAVYKSRVGWSISYLNRAGYFDRVSRGIYRVNDDGKALYQSGISGSDMFQHLQEVIARRDPWRTDDNDTSDGSQAVQSKDTADTKSPRRGHRREGLRAQRIACGRVARHDSLQRPGLL